MFENKWSLAFIKVLFVYDRHLHLRRDDYVIALKTLLNGHLGVIKPLVPILHHIWLVFKVIVSLTVQEAQNLVSVFLVDDNGFISFYNKLVATDGAGLVQERHGPEWGEPK